MLKFIKSIFGNFDALSEAGRLGRSQEFTRLFLASELLLLSLPIAESLDSSLNISEKDFLDLIESAAEQVSEQTEVNLFTYENGSLKLLPVFTSDKAAQTFVEQYVSQVQRLIPFQVLAMKGEILLNYLSDDAKIVLNPKNSSEYQLTETNMAMLMQDRD